MKNSLSMRALHGACDLCHQAYHFPRVVAQGWADLLQAAARSVFHTEERYAFRALAYLVDGQNVGMIEARRRFGFAPETCQRFARVGVITQDALQRYDPARMPLARAIDHTHPPAADLFQDFVVAQPPLRIGHRYCVERLSEARRVRILVGNSSVQETTETKAVRDVRSAMASRTFLGRR